MDLDPRPADKLNSIEGVKSSRPINGPAAEAAILDSAAGPLKIGVITEGYPGIAGVFAAIPGRAHLIPVSQLSKAFGRFWGARESSPLPIGTEVLLYIGPDSNYGYVIGCRAGSAPSPFSFPSQTIIPEGGVNNFSANGPFNPIEWGATSELPVGEGVPVDVMPGDDIVSNGFGVMMGILSTIALMKGSDLAMVQCFEPDDLVRIVSKRFEHFSQMGEKRMVVDKGNLTEEEVFTDTEFRSNGLDTKDSPYPFKEGEDVTLTKTPEKTLFVKTDPEKTETGRWTIHRFKGYLARMVQDFIGRPSRPEGVSAALEGIKNRPDMGVSQVANSVDGAHVVRSVSAVGMVKSNTIAIPQRVIDASTPVSTVDTDGTDEKGFQFSDKNPFAAISQIRDYIGWTFDRYLAKRFRDNPRYNMPEHVDAPSPHVNGKPSTALGGSVLPATPVSDVLKSSLTIEGEGEGVRINFGNASVFILPTGEINMTDASGGLMHLGQGNGIISVLKDFTTVCGGSFRAIAGDDIILKARGSLDFSAELQARIATLEDILIHSENGGMLLSQNGTGEFEKGEGEDLSVKGIVLKAATDVVMSGKQVDIGAETKIYIGSQDKDAATKPTLVVELASETKKITSDIYIEFAGGSGYQISNAANFYSTGALSAEGNIKTKGTIDAAGLIASHTTFLDWDNLSTLVGTDFSSSTINLGRSDYLTGTGGLDSLFFSFRTSEQCAAEDISWPTFPWQIEFSESMEVWKQEPYSDEYASMPFPGRQTYESGTGLWSYTEANVDANGNPKSAANMKSEGGEFSETGFHQLKVPPKR